MQTSKKLLIALCATFCIFGTARADHQAGIFAALCQSSIDYPNLPDSKATKAICRNKIEGFVDGYRFSADRLANASRKCYPTDDDIDDILAGFIKYRAQHPELAVANYSKVLRQYIDNRFHCSTS